MRGVILLQLSQANIDRGSHAFERARQFLTLILRRCACLLPIPGKFIAQPAIDQFEALRQLRLRAIVLSAACEQSDHCSDESSTDQSNHQIKQWTHSGWLNVLGFHLE